MSHLNTLINRWLAGDQKAAEEIYNLHQSRVYRLAYGLLGNAEDAEEAAQDALTYALVNIYNFDEKRSKFTTWLHLITVSRCRDLQRKRKLPNISISEWFQNIRDHKSSDSSPEQISIQTEARASIWAMLQKLTPHLREALILRHWGGHTYQEIADIVGCPIRTAQSRVRLGYQRLERELSTNEQFHFAKEKQ